MDKVLLLGYFATIINTIFLLPQIYKIYITNHTEWLSLNMYCLYLIGGILWLLYAILINNYPLIISTGISIILSVYIICKITDNKNNKNNKINSWIICRIW